MNPQGVALAVIDMQNGFCHDDGSMARLGFDITMLKAAVAPCVRLVSAAREFGIPIIHTQIHYQPGYSDGGLAVHKKSPEMIEVAGLLEGSWDADFVEELQPLPGEDVVGKNRYSAFYAPAFEDALKRLRVSKVVFCGVTTNCCVESTVRDALQSGYEPIVVADATGELEETRHEAALRTMSFLFAELSSVDEMIAEWKNAATPAEPR